MKAKRTSAHSKRSKPSPSDEWRTPLSFIAGLHPRFTWDLACTEETCIVRRCIRAVEEQTHEAQFAREILGSRWWIDRSVPRPVVDTLKHPPAERIAHGDAMWCNPPYSRIPEFVRMCHKAAEFGDVYMLIPAYTDTAIWHDVIFPCAFNILFPRGRLKFEIPGRKSSCARFSTAIVYFAAYDRPGPLVRPGRFLMHPPIDPPELAHLHNRFP